MKCLGSKWHLVVVPAALAMSVFATGCDREGPAERAGESIDRGVENTGDSLERAGERTRDRVTR